MRDDIARESAVLIESNVLSQFLYQYICYQAKQDTEDLTIFYREIERMALDNLGKDMTPILREYIFTEYGHNCSL